MKKQVVVSIGIMALLVLACAPRVAPTSTPTIPIAPSTAPVTPIPMPIKINPEEAEWQKVVEAAKKEGKITLYTWAFVGDLGKAIFDTFQERHGIKVEAITGVGSVLIERIKTEQAAKKSIADTLDTSPFIMLTARDMGLTVSVVSELPVLREKNVWRLEPRYDPEGQILGVAQNSLTTFINTKQVGPGEEPKSLRDLLDPRWKGNRLGISSPLTAPAFVNIYYYRDKYGVDEEFFRQIMKQQPRIGPTVRESNAWLAQGETHVLVPTSDAAMGPFIKEGAPLKPIELQGGVMSYPTPGIAMVRNAPHPNAVRLFLNWLLSPEGQNAYGRAASYTPIRKDVPDFGANTFKFTPRQVIHQSYEDSLTISRLQREGPLAKIMGLEK